MVLVSSHLLLVTRGAVIGGVASSHLLLVTNRAVIGGACEFKSVVSNKWSSNWWCSRVHICC